MPKLNVALSETLYQKLLRKKELDKLGGVSWVDWLRYITRDVILDPTPSELIGQSTRENLANLWAENFILNLPELVDLSKYPEGKEERSIGLLPKHEGRSALVVGAGPSIQKHNHLQVIAESNYGGALFLTDRMLIPCLKAKITPDKFTIYVVSVDGNRFEIPKFFDDPVVDEYADRITGLFAATVAPEAIKRFKGPKHFFLGLLDAFYPMDSVTGFMNYMVKLTGVSCLGNTGAAAIVVADYLKCSPVILCGMDLGYTPELPIEDTAYFKVLEKSGMTTEQCMPFFTKGYNPLFDVEFIQDTVYFHYSNSLLEAIDKNKMSIINATEGGAIFGVGIIGMKLKEALEKWSA